jgi:hypothetical protein
MEGIHEKIPIGTPAALLIWSFNHTASAQAPILSPEGTPTGFISVNPDANGDPWIAGGVTKDQLPQVFTAAPEQVVPRDVAKSASAAPLPGKVDNSITPQFRPVFNQTGG